MNYMNIKKCDITNGEGVRVSLFVSGCDRKCPGCFNPETWPADAGKPYTSETEDEIIEALKSIPHAKGLTLLGGEPLASDKIETIYHLLDRVTNECPDMDIWCYTGYIWEDLIARTENEEELWDVLMNIDILVDGPFVENLADKTLRFRGSRNQRIIQVSESLLREMTIVDNHLMNRE